MLIPSSGWRRITVLAVGLIATVGLSTSKSFSTSPAAPLLISQTPLSVTIPAHPQIVFALANSQSMDGNLSGAIMTGSGSLAGTLGAYAAGQLQPTSSPLNYTIPTGFTPPVNPGAAGQAPYTVNVSGTLVDNSPSRLNVAKAGISAILNAFMEYADFSLWDYQTSNLGEYATWAYYMSPPTTGFTFTSSPSGSYVANPCYNADVTQLDAYSQSCNTLQMDFGTTAVTTAPYMTVGTLSDGQPATSDDPTINDVFYEQSNFQPPICVDAVPNPLDPYTTFSLADYEDGGVIEYYGVPWGMTSGYTYACAPGTVPTNAGYVPYSSQVMNVMRGFGYDATSQSAISGNMVVPMQTSGNVPTAATAAAAIAAFTPYLQPETGNASSTEIKAVAEQSPIAGIVYSAAQYLHSGSAPSSNLCAPAQYIVLVTDGLPTKDYEGDSWPPLGSQAAQNYGLTLTVNPDGSYSTNDRAVHDAITQISDAASEGIKTYVIGLGAGVDPANNPLAAETLTAMAKAGGTPNYFAANSPADLTSDMQVILAQILKAVRSSASATVNTTALNANSMAFQPSFNTSDVDQDWTGDIKAYPIDPGSGTVETSMLDWSAQAQLDTLGWNNRIIATWDPMANAGTPFEWSGGAPMTGIAASTNLGVELESNTSDPNGQHVLDYLRGDQALSIANGGAFRNRTHILADIVDSSPVYVAGVSGPYQTASYYAFESQHPSCNPPPESSPNPCRQSVLYVGANDGMLHAFNALTGQEMFAYIPNAVFSNLINLTNPYYNQEHQFYVDGSPQVGDVQFSGDGRWHTILVSGERAGGNSIFALDVTDPGSITSENALAHDVLWEFSDPNMGLSYSTPVIAQTAAGASGANLGFTVFFGNGYNSPSQMPWLYAVDPQNGAPLPNTPINLCAAAPSACNSSLPNGLSSVTVVNSQGGIATPATTLYAGDLQGNVWRVDIHAQNSANWTVTLLFKATDPSGTPQPITTTPAVSLNPDFPRLAGTMVYVGTGQLLGTSDLNSTQIQSMYGVYDSGTNASPLYRANLLSQCMTQQSQSGQTLRFIHGGQVILPTQNGWLSDFNVPANPSTPSAPCGSGAQSDVGERIVSDPRLIGGALAVISVTPAPTTTTTSLVTPSSLRHVATLAKTTLPAAVRPSGKLLTAMGSARSRAKATPRPTTALESVAYMTRDPARSSATAGSALRSSALLSSAVPGGAGFMDPQSFGTGIGGTRSLSADGVYRPANSTAQLLPVGLGVPPAPTLTSISVTPTDPTITAGQTEEFTATGMYSNGTTQNLTSSVTWSSSSTGVATISGSGLASSTTPGSTTITASLGAISGGTTLTVDPVPTPPPAPTLVSIAVTPANQTIYIGGTQQYTAIGTYSDGSTLNLTGMVTWSSSSTGIATISGGGSATGVAVGSTTITAAFGTVSGNTTLNVTTAPVEPPVTLQSIVVTPANPTIYLGTTEQFVATAYYSDGTSQNVTGEAAWTSSNPGVATIASGGLATSQMTGNTGITATFMGLSGGTTLTVVNRPPPPTLESIIVTPATPGIYVGQTQPFTATGYYSDGTSANLTSTVTWTSSATSIATIASGGVATGDLAGSTMITATDGAVSGNTTLTVRNRPPPPTLLTISVAPVNQIISVGQTQQFVATGHYSDGSTQTLTGVATWSSSNTGIATIVSGGLATGAAIGETTIEASWGGTSGNTTLTVTATPALPPPPVCPGGDVSYLMEFNFAGGAFSSPVFNYNGTSAPTSAIVPANGMLLGGVYASSPVFNSYSAGSYGNGGDIGFIQLGNVQTFAFYQVGFHQQRYSWWEIR